MLRLLIYARTECRQAPQGQRPSGKGGAAVPGACRREQVRAARRWVLTAVQSCERRDSGPVRRRRRDRVLGPNSRTAGQPAREDGCGDRSPPDHIRVIKHHKHHLLVR